MKSTKNKSRTASEQLVLNARKIGLNASVIEHSKPRTRRYSANGSTFAAQKAVEITGIRMSIGQARQYLRARGA